MIKSSLSFKAESVEVTKALDASEAKLNEYVTSIQEISNHMAGVEKVMRQRSNPQLTMMVNKLKKTFNLE